MSDEGDDCRGIMVILRIGLSRCVVQVSAKES